VQAVVEAVRAATLDEAVLDEAVRRILTHRLPRGRNAQGRAFDIDAITTPWRARSPAKAWCCSRMTASCRCKSAAHRRDRPGRAGAAFPGRRQFAHQPHAVDAPSPSSKAGRRRRLTYSEGYPADDISSRR
jgi:hypothetical protein